MAATLTGSASPERPVPGRILSAAEGTATLIALRGKADVTTLPVLVDLLARVIADYQGDVIIDMTQTTLIDTATVRNLDRARQFLDDHGRQLTFRSPPPQSAEMLALYGLSHLVESSP